MSADYVYTDPNTEEEWSGYRYGDQVSIVTPGVHPNLWLDDASVAAINDIWDQHRNRA